MDDKTTLIKKLSELNDVPAGCPMPDQCQLYAINSRLFTANKPLAKAILRYFEAFVDNDMKPEKNQYWFCLLPTTIESVLNDARVPETLGLILVTDEFGSSSEQNLTNLFGRQLSDGPRNLDGVRIEAIIPNPKYNEADYGYLKRCVHLLGEFYRKPVNTKSMKPDNESLAIYINNTGNRRRGAAKVEYLVSQQTFNSESMRFWRKCGFTPVHLTEKAEHEFVVARQLDTSNDWLSETALFFRQRAVNLFAFDDLRNLPSVLAVDLIQTASMSNYGLASVSKSKTITKKELRCHLNIHDLKRLEIYTRVKDDFRRINDLMPILARLYFLSRFGPTISLSPAQSTILMAVGLQRKPIDTISKEIGLPTSQTVAQLVRAIKLITTLLFEVEEKSIEETLGFGAENYANMYAMRPLPGTLDDELEDAAQVVLQEEKKNLAKLSKMEKFKKINRIK